MVKVLRVGSGAGTQTKAVPERGYARMRMRGVIWRRGIYENGVEDS